MYCRHCGALLTDGAKFCKTCGKATTTETVEIVPYHVTSENESSQNNDNAGQVVYENTYQNSNRKRHRILKIGLGIIAILVILAVVVGVFGTSETDMVKGGTLYEYDYGICIGDALHNWFDGREEWDSYEEYGTTYVTASGMNSHTLTGETERQIFMFEIVDDEHFRFLGAYDVEGNEICTTTGNYVTDGIWDYFNGLTAVTGYGTSYETALKAAFGDKESLALFENDGI